MKTKVVPQATTDRLTTIHGALETIERLSERAITSAAARGSALDHGEALKRHEKVRAEIAIIKRKLEELT
jgi:hypothetical protein